MNFYNNNFSLFSDDEILEKVLPVISDDFNQYFFLPYSNEQKKEIVKKIIRKSRDNYDGKELYIDYLRKNLSIYLDEYIKSLFDKKRKKSISILNRYLESLHDVNSLDDAIDDINALTIFASKYNYTINKYAVYKLLEYNDKFMTIASYCVKEQNNISNYNYLIKAIIETYYEKLNNDMYNANYRESQSSYDAYIKEIINIPLLSEREEKELMHDYRNGNLEARDKIIEANLRMVVSIARKHVGYGLSLEDLIQEGNLGLMNAIDNYKDDKNCRFSTYAYYWIRCNIIRAIKNKGKLIRLPDYMYDQMLKFKKAKKELERNLMHQVTVEEMASHLNIPLKKAMILYRSIMEPGSLNIVINDEDDKEMGDSKISDVFIPEEEIMKRDYKDVVFEMLKEAKLSEKELDIIHSRYGFNGDVEVISELSNKYGVSCQFISFIVQRALKKIRKIDNIDYYHDYYIGKQK